MEFLIPLVALTAMEIVLGIDNIVFITIITGRLPVKQQPKARRLGLTLALVMRIMLLFSIAIVLGMKDPLFHLSGFVPESWLSEEIDAVSIKDMILFGGGLFLIWKSVHEVHARVQGDEESHRVGKQITFGSVLFQIAMMDIIFSLDSVITAVGMVQGTNDDGSLYLPGIMVMVVAVMIAVGIMLVFAEHVSRFVEQNPTLKMLAISFLLLIGVMLVAEGIGTDFDKGYIYFAMAFAMVVELLNMRIRHKPLAAEPAPAE
jgi:predicted tellurium resistance membrane protein TerC